MTSTRAVAAARAAQPAWAERTPVERGEILRELAQLLRERRDEASEIVAAETGKPLELALGETDAAVEMGHFVAGEGRRSYGRTTDGEMKHRTVLTVRQPLGVAGLIIELQHSAPEHRLEGVSRAPLRQCGGGEAVRGCSRVRALLRRAGPRGGRPAGSAERRPGARRRGGSGARRARGRRPRQLHRIGCDGPLDQRDGGAATREGVPRARGEERARRLRRRGSPKRGPLGARLRLLERRTALCGRQPDRRLRRRLRRASGRSCSQEQPRSSPSR